MKKVIELRDLNMSFDKKGKFLQKEKKIHVLRDINLDIYEGEIVAIVGESGCGKTTIGKIITGILKPTKGEVLIDGKNIYKFDINNFFKAREKVQFIQQDSYAALNPVRTIAKSLSAPIKHHFKGISSEECEMKMKELLMRVGLNPPEQFLSKYPHMCSGGQRQRVLMARAISIEPSLIVADEPVSMIDVSMRLSILNLMSDFNKNDGISFVYITHDLATARYIAQCGRIVVMYLGEIVEEGKIDEVLQDPRHPYTQALIAAVPTPDPKIAKKARKIPIKSMDLGSLENRPEGCVFYDRCPYACEKCKEKIDYEMVGTRRVKCCRLGEVPKWNH